MVVAGFDAEFVVASSNILDEGMASNHHRRGAVGSQSAHWANSCLEPTMVVLYPIVGVSLGAVNSLRKQFLNNAQ